MVARAAQSYWLVVLHPIGSLMDGDAKETS